ncbi:MAG: gliding motility-associated C-terminal domain-containing protein [Saprospiraceae bacterium]|nr:gliding motility-associated C-terminal domain-containing protein [Saprospiraceae bacterium]
METILNSDGSICVPCAGILTDCNNGTKSVVNCDDGNPCTINDVQTILDCNGNICVPCVGIVQDCSTGSTTTRPCNDGNASTINDIETILNCNGEICIDCIGQVVQITSGWIADIFSPNGDGVNDVLKIYIGTDIKQVSRFEIFDRWGSKVYEESNITSNTDQKGWNGFYKSNNVSPGVYIYVAIIEFTNGKIETKAGNVTVIY